jgi:hypothetical protein
MSRLRRPSLYERCIFAVAAGHAGGGDDAIMEAAAHMAHVQSRTYKHGLKPTRFMIACSRNSRPCTTTSSGERTMG